MSTTLDRVKGLLGDLSKSLDALNDAPAPTLDAPAGVIGRDGNVSALDGGDYADMRLRQMDLRRQVASLPDADLKEMLSIQASKSAGVQADGSTLNTLANANPTIAKLLDTSGGSALIRQDLEPFIYATFVKRFPYWDRIAKEPSNGLVHAYNQITAYGAAVFQTELGTAQDDSSTFARQTSPIAVLATRRGVTLKEQFAVSQGGAPYNSLGVELASGATAMAYTLQKALFQGNATTSAASGASTELGAYDANAFTGLRLALGATGTGSPVIVEKSTSSYVSTINTTVGSLLDNGASPSAVVMTGPRYAEWANEQISMLRDAPGNAQAQGYQFGSIVTAAGPLPIVVVPGNSIGSYAISAVNKQDFYILDESTLSMPYLGSDSLTTLEIPVGVAGALTRLYIIFGMFGLAVKVPSFNAKVRVNI